MLGNVVRFTAGAASIVVIAISALLVVFGLFLGQWDAVGVGGTAGFLGCVALYCFAGRD
jgi:hypothetical protein